MTASHSWSVIAANDLSLKIPALATKMWTPPKASNAALTRASPSSAEHTAPAAFPPANTFHRQSSRRVRLLKSPNL